MSLDLQGLQQGLQGIVRGSQAAEAASKTLRIVDAYIKAYYIPWGEELHRWALTHPEYTIVRASLGPENASLAMEKQLVSMTSYSKNQT